MKQVEPGAYLPCNASRSAAERLVELGFLYEGPGGLRLTPRGASHPTLAYGFDSLDGPDGLLPF